MQYRTLPTTDCSVSVLCLGNFVFGTNWWTDADDDTAVAMQNQAVEIGVNFFDTAPAYGNGRAQKLLARTIKDVGRDRLVISTKFGYDLHADPGEEGSHRERKQDFSKQFILSECEQTLAQLGIDCIDLYQAHNVKLPHMIDELYDAMATLTDQGKIRAWGVALGPAIGWREEGVLALEQPGCATVQTVYNLYEQDPGKTLGQLADSRGCGVLARVPTNSGILDDEFQSPDHVFGPNDHRKFRDRNWLVYGLKKNDMVRPVAAELGLSLRQFAFRWLMQQPGMMSIEPNMLTIEDVQEFANAADAPAIGGDVLAQLDELYADDFGLGEAAHPCDVKSSTAESGAIRSDINWSPASV